MPTVHPFHVVPALPEPLRALRELAYNLRWAWDHETIDLFKRLDPVLWEQTSHNPVRMLGIISQNRLRDAALDESFLDQLNRVRGSQESYVRAAYTWFRREHSDALNAGVRIAYFSMEFGITECLPIYSGGLGVLSGDHLKSASDLGLPLIGIGLLYQQGYFRQFLSADGWQQERYPENDFYNLPLQPERDASGQAVRVSIVLPGRTVQAQVWRAQVGRVPLLLLDTNIPVNSPDDQNITDQLYGGDQELRLKQEIVLGIGGMLALHTLGLQPAICHMNEGHAAFMAVERNRVVMRDQQVDYRTAREATAAGNLFTTHTPVPAGFDVFPRDLLERYLGAYVQKLGISFDEFMGLGRVNRLDAAENFNMAVFALRHSHHVNGVSRLHGRVTRRMVQSGYSGFSEEEIPVSYVTNGIHIRSFISDEMATLLDRYLGGRWQQDVSDTGTWSRVASIPDEALWRVRSSHREQVVTYARTRLRAQYEARGMREAEVRHTREVLNPEVLTIGFARRFATYKRATLLFSDPDRLLRLLNDPQRPVQLLIAGKAHPRDDGGKEMIRQIAQFARRDDARNRVVFIEDYDLDLARHLVQGVDVWLNTPRRPMEASGTSGMKILANGGLNLSIPDGWWAEGYDPSVGWSIGNAEEYSDPNAQDRAEASSLYEILERELVPLFYDRTVDGIPRAWIARIKNSMQMLCPRFNTHRMVAEYTERFYLPCAARSADLMANKLDRAGKLVQWKLKVHDAWPKVRVDRVVAQPAEPGVEPPQPSDRSVSTLRVGDKLHVTAFIELGSLTPEDVSVQAVYGALDTDHHVANGVPAQLAWCAQEGEMHRYEGDLASAVSGMQGFSVRVLPSNSDAALPQELALVAWE